MTSERFFEKAEEALRSAEILFAAESFGGACNRAYYAMHNAARSALIAVGQETIAASKTHSGLLSAFGQHIIKPGLIDSKWSAVFAKEERRRLLADYDVEAITRDDARQATANAAGFVEVIADLLQRLS